MARVNRETKAPELPFECRKSMARYSLTKTLISIPSGLHDSLVPVMFQGRFRNKDEINAPASEMSALSAPLEAPVGSGGKSGILFPMQGRSAEDRKRNILAPATYGR
jgi:hypothetical protein